MANEPWLEYQQESPPWLEYQNQEPPKKTLRGFGKNIFENLTGIAQSSPSYAGIEEYKRAGSPLKAFGTMAKETGRQLYPHGIGSPVSILPASIASQIPTTEQAKGQAGLVKDIVTSPIETTYQRPVDVAQTAGLALGAIPALRGEFRANRISKIPKLMEKATSTYRDILRPSAEFVRKYEATGKDLNSTIKKAAELNLPIDEANGVINTKNAMEIVDSKISEIHGRLDNVLKQSKIKVSLVNAAQKAKDMIDEKPALSAATQAEMKADIDYLIGEELKKHGTGIVNGMEANNIKKGLWKEGYREGFPTRDKSARAIGWAINDTIDKLSDNPAIKQLNRESGQLQDLKNILYKSQKPIPKPQLRKYGKMALGAKVLEHVPVVGPLIGAGAGLGLEAITRYLESPSRKAQIAGQQMQKAMKWEKMLRGKK